MQRIRITFSRGEEIKYISHLDMMRMWERVFRRAGLPLAYTKGFNPHPRLSLAAPLPVGTLALAEMLDVYLESVLLPDQLWKDVERQLPPGAGISRVEEVEATGPSLSSMVRAAEYEVAVTTFWSRRDMEERVDRLLWTSKLMRERRVPKGASAAKGHAEEARRYNLRLLIEDVWVDRWNFERVLGMRLKASPGATGRPEDVLDELRLAPNLAEITRTRLILA
jgi:radical SAM-linked protein